MRSKQYSLGIIFLAVIAALGIAGVAIAMGSGWTTHTGEQLPPDPTAAKSADCSGAGAIFCDGFESGNTMAWSPQACQVPDVTLPVMP